MFPLKLASSQVNTKASAGLAVGLAKEIFGPELPTPLPHQVGSTPGGVKSPAPGLYSSNRDEISGGSFYSTVMF